MSSENTLALLCRSSGTRQSASRWSKYTALNSLTVQLDPGMGTSIHLSRTEQPADWAMGMQIQHDASTASPELIESIDEFIKPHGLGRASMRLSAGNGLVATYHPWREIGSDGHSAWLRASLMCPEMDVIREYPAVAACAMLWHQHVARECEFLAANVTLHIPRLFLMLDDLQPSLPPAVQLRLTPQGRLFPVESVTA